MLAIMQPYFFPYIGYMQLLNAADRFVILDDVNFINKGWINRNRILLNNAPHLFTLPLVKASQNRLICDIEILHDERFVARFLSQLQHTYSKQPAYTEVRALISSILTLPYGNLADYLAQSLRIICNYLGIEVEMIRSSSLVKDAELKGVARILTICEQMGATQYVNAIGGRELYSHHDFLQRDIDLSFLKTAEITYTQLGGPFITDLSIIDLLMFNPKERVRDFLTQFELLL